MPKAVMALVPRIRAICPLCSVPTELEVVFGRPVPAPARRSAEILCKGCNNTFKIEALAEFFPEAAQGFALDDVQGRT